MTPAEYARRLLQKAHEDMKRLDEDNDKLRTQVKQLESSLAYQNKMSDAYRGEAQEARSSERKAWAKADELAKALRASQTALANCEAARATLESRVK